MTDRYSFLRTTERDGQLVAMFADQARLGESGVKSLRHAFAAHASPLIREGVVIYTPDQMREHLPDLEKRGMTNSVAAFNRALQVIDEKTRKPGQDARPAARAPTRGV